MSLFYVNGCVACIDTCVPHACSARGGQKRALDPLELELQKTVSFHVGAGNPNQVLKGQPVLVNVEPSLQLLCPSSYYITGHKSLQDIHSSHICRPCPALSWPLTITEEVIYGDFEDGGGAFGHSLASVKCS